MQRRAIVAALVLVLVGVAIVNVAPAAAFDLFARHQVTVQFATQDGKPMANAEVRVFAPGEPNRPSRTGRTDSEGKFEFPADKDGFWSAEARAGDEIARATVRVGGEQQQSEPLSPYWVLGGLFLLLVLAFALRIARARARRPR
jgi:nickel transport protein